VRQGSVTKEGESSIGGGADELFPELYRELRRLAAAQLRRERVGHTLQTTALVHEAYLRLVGRSGVTAADESGFFRAAAQTIRHVLVDHARRRAAQKRVGGRRRLELDSGIQAASEAAVDVLALDEALGKLHGLHPRQAEIVELRFFGGRSVPETAALLGVSPRTVEADWAMARAWLREVLVP